MFEENLVSSAVRWLIKGWLLITEGNIYAENPLANRFWTGRVGGVPRLDGARGKKQVWRPHVRTCGLSEANVLY